ncbi:hypothetical protein [Streptomyces sp. NPDC087300]|uniref:hypothetical protein n=1 Tax=Streptomyces sp. NPDC087300 TaxID=3365780 RepID=UPI003826C8C6
MAALVAVIAGKSERTFGTGMTNTANSSPPPQGSFFHAAPLPDAPGPAGGWPDRGALLQAQSTAFKTLVREDLSRGRGLVFFACSVLVTLVALSAPVLVVGSVTGEDSDSTDVAVTVAGALVLFVVVALSALVVLRSLRGRGQRRARLLRQWAAADRGCESEFPSGYGSQGVPHSRLINAAVILVVAFLLAALVLADVSDPDVLVMLPGLVAAGCFAWATVRKYADRYSWASRENVIRGRERRRLQNRERLHTAVEAQGAGIRPALLYIALFAPVVIVAVVFAIARPKNVLGLLVVGLIALAVLLIGFPKVALGRNRERARPRRSHERSDDFVRPGHGCLPHPLRPRWSRRAGCGRRAGRLGP